LPVTVTASSSRAGPRLGVDWHPRWAMQLMHHLVVTKRKS